MLKIKIRQRNGYGVVLFVRGVSGLIFGKDPWKTKRTSKRKKHAAELECKVGFKRTVILCCLPYFYEIKIRQDQLM